MGHPTLKYNSEIVEAFIKVYINLAQYRRKCCIFFFFKYFILIFIGFRYSFLQYWELGLDIVVSTNKRSQAGVSKVYLALKYLEDNIYNVHLQSLH